MEPVKFAIVGTGGIGTSHGRVMEKVPDVELIGLCDIIEDRMDAFEAELGRPMKKYAKFEELCQDPEIEAIFVGTPNQVHVPVILAAAKYGKNVMSTKPLSSSKEAAKDAVEAVEAAGIVNSMSLTMRFSPQVQYLGKLCRSGQLGDIYYAKARSIRRSGIPDWNLGFIEAGGGAFRDMGVHVLDASWWLLGQPKPVSVSGVGGAKFGPIGKGYWDFRQPDKDYWGQYDSDDYAGGVIRFENGTGLICESFWASHQAPEVQVELFGTEGGAKLQPLTLYKTVDGAPQDTTVEMANDRINYGQTIFGHFADCVRNGTPEAAPLRHGLIVQTMMEAMLESAATGKEVVL